jgi:hypothetical protein
MSDNQLLNTDKEKKRIYIISFVSIMTIVLAIVLITRWSDKLHNKRYSRQTIREVRALVRESDYTFIVSKQDMDPLVRLQHLTKSISLLDVARRIMNSTDLMKITKVDVDVMIQELEKQRSETMEQVKEYSTMRNVVDTHKPIIQPKPKPKMVFRPPPVVPVQKKVWTPTEDDHRALFE